MNKIYLISDGEYSDYRITAAYSTMELAQGHVDLMGGQIELYDVDPNYKERIPNYKEGYFPFRIIYDIDENTFEVKKYTWSESSNDVNYCLPYGGKANDRWAIRCIAQDEFHALKISNERIMQIKAMGYLHMSFEEYWKIKFGEGQNYKDI